MKKKFPLTPILFLLPSVFFLAVFIYIPLVQNFYNSFFDFNVFSNSKEFVGLAQIKSSFKMT